MLFCYYMKSKHIECLKKAIGYIYVYSSYIAMVYFFHIKFEYWQNLLGWHFLL